MSLKTIEGKRNNNNRVEASKEMFNNNTELKAGENFVGVTKSLLVILVTLSVTSAKTMEGFI